MQNLFYSLRNKTIERRCQVYGIGAAKTGTTSLARLMADDLRSHHEPKTKQTTRVIIDYLEGKLTEQQVAQYLLKRDHSLFLELEASPPLGYVCPILARIFPESKFIVTIRDPKKWLRSRLNYHHGISPKEWEKYRKFIWSRHDKGHAACEKVLLEKNLYPISAYLGQYAEQYKIIFDNIDKSRVLIVNTDNINTSVNDIAEFCSVLNVQLEPKVARQYKPSENVIDRLPSDFVDHQIEEYTKDLRQYL
jgi:hypothetical protein